MIDKETKHLPTITSEGAFLFWCDACRSCHHVTEGTPVRIKTTYTDGSFCHITVRDNVIVYEMDTKKGFAGQIKQLKKDMSRYYHLVDNGHGKDTPGKRSPELNGKVVVFEYEYNRRIANRIIQMMPQFGLEGELLVTEIYDISLEKRAERANRIQAQRKNCILTSIHANAHQPNPPKVEWTKASGFEFFTTVGQNNSDNYAQALIEATKLVVTDKVKLRTDDSDGDGDKEANFAILRLVNMPAVLSENGFMTNLEEAQKMLTDEWIEMVATIHITAMRYIEESGVKTKRI